MSEVHVYTSFTFTYLSRARVLASTLKRFHPDWVFWAVIVDEPPPGFDFAPYEAEFDRILYASSLYPDIWKGWIFKHNVIEASTAVKARALLHIFEQGADKVIYLDPDIAVFGDLNEISAKLDHFSIALTPHQLAPNFEEAALLDNELVSLKYGVFNLGFIAVSRDPEGQKMARWWAFHLHRACYEDVENGIFTDQKYCDLIPSLFNNVLVDRRPEYNVASWNLSRRKIEIVPSGEILVNGNPLKFYHFTKINSDGESMTARYAGDNLDVLEIWNWYRRAIAGHEASGVPSGYWAYGTFEDGTPIPRQARLAYRKIYPSLPETVDPFASGPGSFQAWFAKNEMGDLNKTPWKAPFDSNANRARGERSLAVVLHAFYPDLVPKIIDRLRAYRGDMKLFVTTTPEKERDVRAVLEDFPGPVEYLLMENHGRDILPFLTALGSVLDQGYPYVLKLHTKRSSHLANGADWLQELVESLADPNEMAWTIDKLQAHPEVGIVGPQRHVLALSAYWGANQLRVEQLAARMGLAGLESAPPVFVAGSMFLARTSALEALYRIGLTPAEFECEEGQTDATLAHAVERALTYSAAAKGLKVAVKPRRAAGRPGTLGFEIAYDYDFAPRSDIAAADTRFSDLDQSITPVIRAQGS